MEKSAEVAEQRERLAALRPGKEVRLLLQESRLIVRLATVKFHGLHIAW